MINDAPTMQSASANYSPVKIAVLAPRWLQEALSILLLSEDSLMLVTNAQTEDELFAQSLSQIPDIIVIDADFRLNKALEQITRIKTKLQSANCIMLVDQANQDRPLTEAGADAVILKGSPPSYLLEIIKQIAEKRWIEIKGKSKP